jgi:urease accessory protein
MTATTMAATPTTTTEALRLLAWLSPAFPTGAFAYSHGIEWAVQAGDIADSTSLRAWVEDVLRHGAGYSDAILLRHMLADLGEDTDTELAALARAAQPSRERLAETSLQGEAFSRAARAWAAPHPAAAVGAAAGQPYPIALATLARRHGIDADLLCAGFLQAFAANLISAAVRLVPLGQSDGLAVLAALEPVILDVAAGARAAALDDLGGCAWRGDIASMRHETQYTRLFRS